MATQHSLFLAAALLLLLLICAGNAQELRQLKPHTGKDGSCDLFQGEWIFDPDSEPAYPESCPCISSPQNCLRNGRTDTAYLHWKWRPYGCALPAFNPEKFLSFMKNKSLGFIGDSVDRNQRDSLVCLLSKVEKPVQLDHASDDETWYFPSCNLTVTLVYAQFLLKTENEDQSDQSQPLLLHLDVLDTWTEKYHNFDYVVIGVGPWFLHYSYMVENNTVVGCHGCKKDNVTELGKYYALQRALSLAFSFITTTDHKPFVIYRMHAPNHFEHGYWHNGGYCNRTVPFRGGDLAEFKGDRQDPIIEAVTREEFYKAAAAARKNNGVHLELMDIYYLSLLRPDGHPNDRREDHKHDCLHWCMPGAIDTWNDVMMEMMVRNEGLRHST